MKEKRDRKKYMLAGAALSVVLAAAGLIAVLLRGQMFGADHPNLALQRGVTATCDSVEAETLSAAMAIDGEDADRASRWSSENNRENASHYIQLEFPKEISVSFVVLKWERRNVISYALEGSLDGAAYETLAAFDRAPETLRQEIVLAEPANVRFLRLSTYAVSKEQADFSDLYQNVSLYEFEVYKDKPTAYQLKAPVIENASNGERRLVMPETPEGFRVTLIGADLEQVIGADGRVFDTIQDKEVTIGYRVEDTRGREETREVSFTVYVPAAGDAAVPEQSGVGAAGAQETEQSDKSVAAVSETGASGRNERPDQAVFPAVAEWKGGKGYFVLREDARIVVDMDSQPPDADGTDAAEEPMGDRTADGEALQKGAASKAGSEAEPSGDGNAVGEASQKRETSENTAQALWETAALMNEQMEKRLSVRTSLTVCRGTMQDVRQGDIYLGYAEEANGLGGEGYTCDITDKCVIKAEAATGIRWGTVTLMQLLSGDAGKGVPRGQIRDYPLYQVRGFGIDVARKAVSMDTLYAMLETMSWYKMNDLEIHLNDNTILATSGLTASAEQAMTADSAFRLESGVLGVQAGGTVLSPREYAYTREEFARFIAAAKTYGVTVVPEIDTPAHSLAITKRYPEYALRTANEAVDQIDLGNAEAVAFVEKLWREALDKETGAFRQAQTVNIGMDEYYGDGEQYRQYLNRINDLVQESGKTVRLWGSLSNIGGTTSPSPKNLQMNLWSTVWADPREMYEAGYSIINMQNNHLYIIPGGGYDYLDSEELFANWSPDRFYDYNQMETVPSYAPQMLGAAYMIWNDMSGNLDLGICEYDLYERFLEPLGVLSGRLWGSRMPESLALLRERMGEGECQRKPMDEDDSDAPCRGAARCQYLYGNTEAVEPGYEISMKIRLDEDTPDGQAEVEMRQTQAADRQTQTTAARQAQVIAAGDCAYGEWAFYAVEPETGKVGFAREGKTYTFDYVLPKGAWVNLKLEGKSGQTTLYVDGKKADSLGSNEPFEEHATFVFPLQRVGEQTGAFDGELEFEGILAFPK